MDKKAYKQLLVSLKKCELNYHAHVREFGKLGKAEISFWVEQLFDFSAERIERTFNAHINGCSFFPTVKDIREGTVENPKRKPCEDNYYLSKLEEDRRLLPSPKTKKIPMPDELKMLFNNLREAVKLKRATEELNVKS